MQRFYTVIPKSLSKIRIFLFLKFLFSISLFVFIMHMTNIAVDTHIFARDGFLVERYSFNYGLLASFVICAFIFIYVLSLVYIFNCSFELAYSFMSAKAKALKEVNDLIEKNENSYSKKYLLGVKMQQRQPCQFELFSLINKEKKLKEKQLANEELARSSALLNGELNKLNLLLSEDKTND
jgi:hypothetical protein